MFFGNFTFWACRNCNVKASCCR